MSTVSSTLLYQGPSETGLKQLFVGRRFEDIDGPAAIIDVAVVRRNCRAMLKTTEKLGVEFRAHVKTHKTTQLTRLQVGDSGPVKLVVSTVAEFEQLIPFLLECRRNGRDDVNVLYGVPPTPSATRRLAELARLLAPVAEELPPLATPPVSFLVDHPKNPLLEGVSNLPFDSVSVFIKIDTGYHRSGVAPESQQLDRLLDKVSELQKTGPQKILLDGFYSHKGDSYGGNTPADALEGLKLEIEGLKAAVEVALQKGLRPQSQWTLSVGATPTATAAQNLMLAEWQNEAQAAQLYQLINDTHKPDLEGLCQIELHAGVYPLLDLQQVATHARPESMPNEPYVAPLSYADIGLRILVEVASLYPERQKPEALIAAGSLALGRELCKAYPGWGIVTPPRINREKEMTQASTCYNEKNRTGWIVARISQEHGILAWEGSEDQMDHLEIGQKLLLYVNHSCIAGAGFGWYLIVDSDKDGMEADVIRDVWVRWRGW